MSSPSANRRTSSEPRPPDKHPADVRHVKTATSVTWFQTSRLPDYIRHDSSSARPRPKSHTGARVRPSDKSAEREGGGGDKAVPEPDTKIKSKERKTSTEQEVANHHSQSQTTEKPPITRTEGRIRSAGGNHERRRVTAAPTPQSSGQGIDGGVIHQSPRLDRKEIRFADNLEIRPDNAADSGGGGHFALIGQAEAGRPTSANFLRPLISRRRRERGVRGVRSRSREEEVERRMSRKRAQSVSGPTVTSQNEASITQRRASHAGGGQPGQRSWTVVSNAVKVQR